MMTEVWYCIMLSILSSTSQARVLSSSTVLQFQNTSTNIALLITIETEKIDQHQITIAVAGPINRDYFAIGFGNNQMLNTYSIIFYSNNNVEEYYLSSKSSEIQQKKLATSIAVEYMANEFNTNTKGMVITRDTKGISNDHYTFDLNPDDELDIIYAMSQNQADIIIYNGNQIQLGYHGDYKGVTKLKFEEVGHLNQTSAYDYIDDMLDIDYFNETEVLIYTDPVIPPKEDKLFIFFSKTQWIMVGAIFCGFLILSFVVSLFYKFYRGWDRVNKQCEERDEIGSAYVSPERTSIVHHCYNQSESILSELDRDILDEMDRHHHYNRSRVNIDHLLSNVISQERFASFDHRKDLIPLRDDDEDEIISDLSDAGSVRM